MPFMNPVFGGNVLIRPALRSPNYTPGVSGWSINRDGSAELNNLTIRGTFYGSDYVISSAGVFFYSGTPAAGNMTGSWAAASGTDAYGNTYPAGLQITAGSLGAVLLDPTDGFLQSTGSSGAVINVGDGQITFNQPGQTSQGLIIQNLSRTHGSLYLSGGTAGTGDEEAQLGIVTSYGAPVAGSTDTFPRTSSSAGSGSTVAHHYVSGAVVKSDAVANVAETWQTPSPYNTGWSGTTVFGTVSNGLRTLQYRRDAEDNLWLCGTFTAASGAGNSVFNLPTAYRPKVNCALPVAFISSTGTAGNAWCYVSVAGNLNINGQLGSTTTAGTTYTVNGKIPLGNIG